MAWTSGTATDYLDLLDKLEVFLTTDSTLVGLGQEWDLLRDDTVSGEREIVFKGKGTAGTDEIIVGIKTYSNVIDDYYNWRLQGMTGFNGIRQVETITCTAGASATGNVTMTITASGMTNSPKPIVIAVTSGDTINQIADKVRTALQNDIDVSGFFTISGTNADVIITKRKDADNDTTLSFGFVDTDTTGVTFGPSTNTTAGFQGAEFDNQPGTISTEPPKMKLWDTSIPYWFIASGRRFIIVAKVSTIYQMMYGGFIYTYGQPNQYPYPLFIGGGSSSYDGERWSTNGNDDSMFWDSRYYNTIEDGGTLQTSAQIFHGSWYSVYNIYSNSAGTYRYTFPYSEYNINTSANNPIWSRMISNFNNDKPLFPIIIQMRIPSKNTFGEFDGICAVPGDSAGSEDTITVGADTYLIVQNVFRTDIFNYCAIKLA